MSRASLPDVENGPSLPPGKGGRIILNNQETKEQRKSDYFVSLLLGCSTLPFRQFEASPWSPGRSQGE
jgi:hypothetical protein